MEIIPVIDIKGAVVVRARMGRRDQYRPIETPLSSTSDPVDVARGLLSVYPFTTLYVADLDAIEDTGDNRAALARLNAACPGLTLWIDNGIAERHAAERFLDAGLGHLVFGSETQGGDALLRLYAQDRRVALSLDFSGDRFQGPPAILAEPALWPADVIVMTLARVGSGAGPDLDRLAAVRRLCGDRLVYAAGGVRHVDDLAALNRCGVAGALVASALHDGRLTRAEIEAL